MSESRIRNSILNILSSLGGTVAYDIGYFFLRAIFIRTLSEEYLGVEGLFSSVLGMLSLMELGIGPAMSISLYRPVAEKDTEKIKSLMRMYRKAYCIVGIGILVLGLILTPFLQHIIQDPPKNIPNLKLIFLLYLANTIVSYFCIYKQSLFIAHQKYYIVTFWYNLFRLLMLVAQGIILIITRNFILYLLLQIVFQQGANLFISRRADRQFPYLRDKNVQPLDVETLTGIKRYAFSSVILNLGGKLVYSTDQIIISGFIGLGAGGLYSNYVMVTSACSSIVTKVFNAFTASAGNLYVSGSTEQFKTVFYRVLFLGMWFSTFAVTGLFCMLQDFIVLWVGPTMLLPENFLICLLVSFFLYILRLPVQVFNSATGNYHHMKYRAVVEGIINLIVSLLLVRYIGLLGVVIGTIISCALVPLWIEPYIFYKHVLKSSMLPYWVMLAKTAVLTIGLCVLTKYLCGFIPGDDVLTFLLKLFICCIAPNAVLFLVYFRSDHLRYYCRLAQRILKRITSK